MRRAVLTVGAVGVLLVVGCSDATAPEPNPELVFESVAAGNGFSCALTDGTAYCWGRNDLGQLGRGATGADGAPGAVVGDHRFHALAAGESNVCGVTPTGSIYCWGHGQIFAQAAPLSEPTLVPAPSGIFEAVGVGLSYGCGRTKSQEIWCWGQNVVGQLGNGSTQSSPSATKVVGERIYSDFDLGVLHACALSGSDVWCWGFNSAFALGPGTEAGGAYAVPRRVPLEAPVTALAAGPGFTCVRVEASDIRCWGVNSMGQLGSGSASEPSPEPLPLLLPASVHSLYASGVNSFHTHACALTSGGEAWCWGAAGHGRLGRMGPESCEGLPCAPEPGRAAPDLAFAGLALGADHTCGASVAGEIHCWGNNARGQRGWGAAGESTEPGRVRVDP